MSNYVKYLQDLIYRIEECVNIPYAKLRKEVKSVINNNYKEFNYYKVYGYRHSVDGIELTSLKIIAENEDKAQDIFIEETNHEYLLCGEVEKIEKIQDCEFCIIGGDSIE